MKGIFYFFVHTFLVLLFKSNTLPISQKKLFTSRCMRWSNWNTFFWKVTYISILINLQHQACVGSQKGSLQKIKEETKNYNPWSSYKESKTCRVYFRSSLYSALHQKKKGEYGSSWSFGLGWLYPQNILNFSVSIMSTK